MDVKKTLTTLVLAGFTSLAFSQQALLTSPNSLSSRNIPITEATSPVKEEKKIIVIDPGHDKRHKPYKFLGVAEHENTLKIAQLIRDQLEPYNFEIILTREDDNPMIRNSRTKDLKARSGLAGKVDADLFLSIHTNHNRNKKKRGMEIFYYGFSNWKYIGDGRKSFFRPEHTRYGSKPSQLTAEHMQKYIQFKTDIPVSVMGSDLTVLRTNYRNKTELNRKRLLFEVGYESNEVDRYLIRNYPEFYASLIAGYILENIPHPKEVQIKTHIQSIAPLTYNTKPQISDFNLQPVAYKEIKKKKSVFAKLFGRD